LGAILRFVFATLPIRRRQIDATSKTNKEEKRGGGKGANERHVFRPVGDPFQPPKNEEESESDQYHITATQFAHVISHGGQ
jgi:hypothetical protein